MGKEDFAKMQEELINKALAGDKAIVLCKCGNAIEFSAGKIDYSVKNEEGKVVSKAAAKHMSEHRIRCNECTKNFCRSCKVEPYHLGFTCNTYQKHINAPKCAACGKNAVRNKFENNRPICK